MAIVEVMPLASCATGVKRPLEQASGLPHHRRLRRKTAAGQAQLARTVGDLVGRRGTVVCRNRATLGDAVDLMMLHDRTSAAVVDSDGSLVGALTENDILHAYAENMHPDCSIDTWLRAQSHGRPGELLGALTVEPSATLAAAAKLLREHANDEAHFRHLVVKDAVVQDEVGGLRGILSAMDLARALCSCSADGEVKRRMAHTTAADIMKHRTVLPVCHGSATLAHALELMNSTRQNCVLIAEGDLTRPSDLVGVLTPRDVLRGFVEHVPHSVPVSHWVRGLQSHWVPRAVVADEPVRKCAAKMARGSMHHLIVLSAATGGLAGVLSSTDLAQAVGSAERLVERCMPSDE